MSHINYLVEIEGTDRIKTYLEIKVLAKILPIKIYYRLIIIINYFTGTASKSFRIKLNTAMAEVSISSLYYRFIYRLFRRSTIDFW